MSAFGGGFNRSVQHPVPRSSAGLIEPQGDPIQVRLSETLEICSPGNTVASSRWRSWLSLLLRHETRPCIPLHMRTSASGKIRGCCIDRLNRQPIADMEDREKVGLPEQVLGDQTRQSMIGLFGNDRLNWRGCRPRPVPLTLRTRFAGATADRAKGETPCPGCATSKKARRRLTPAS